MDSVEDIRLVLNASGVTYFLILLFCDIFTVQLNELLFSAIQASIF